MGLVTQIFTLCMNKSTATTLKVGNQHLLESIVRLTENQDWRALEQCLIDTLLELVAADELHLYEAEITVDGISLKLLAQTSTTLLTAFDPSEDAVRSFEQDPDVPRALALQACVTRDADATGQHRVIYPIRSGRETNVILVVFTHSTSPAHHELTSAFIQIYRNHMQLLHDNKHDILTGLLNRKEFDTEIMELMAACYGDSRRDSDMHFKACLAILDIDNFKMINDNHGHPCGDEVLLLFARLAEQTFRNDDLCFRFGGDEFIVVLKRIDIKLAMHALERFRIMVENFAFPQVGQITISIGVVEILSQELPTSIIKQADRALYYAKKNGRNQVWSYEKLVEMGAVTEAEHSSSVELFSQAILRKGR